MELICKFRNHDVMCRLCDKYLKSHSKINSIKIIKVHLVHVHCRNKRFDCKECAAKYTTSQQLLCHCKTHHPDILYHCSSCSKAFFDESELNKHKVESWCSFLLLFYVHLCIFTLLFEISICLLKTV